VGERRRERKGKKNRKKREKERGKRISRENRGRGRISKMGDIDSGSSCSERLWKSVAAEIGRN